MTDEPRWQIRRLEQGDMPAFRPLRLQALRDHPEAFGSSFEEEVNEDLARLIGKPPSVTLGGFVAGELVGSAGFVVPTRTKQRHKGQVWGVYLIPSARRSGLAAALIDCLIAEARRQELMMLTLTVTVGNPAARHLYLNAGFVPYGIEPGGLRVGSKLLDDELMSLRLVRDHAERNMQSV